MVAIALAERESRAHFKLSEKARNDIIGHLKTVPVEAENLHLLRPKKNRNLAGKMGWSIAAAALVFIAYFFGLKQSTGDLFEAKIYAVQGNVFINQEAATLSATIRAGRCYRDTAGHGSVYRGQKEHIRAQAEHALAF